MRLGFLVPMLALGVALAAAAQTSGGSWFLDPPLLPGIYTADPSAHVFGGRLYVYPSHDIDAGVPPDDLGSHFAMRDYHVLSLDRIGGAVKDHGVALDLANVPWARRQMWAPDAAERSGQYYLSYSTGDTHFLVYATGDSPYGPFTYRGRIMEPVLGWTTHHSIVESDGKWYLFYHDAQLSKGQTHLRNITVTPLVHRPDGTIETIVPYRAGAR